MSGAAASNVGLVSDNTSCHDKNGVPNNASPCRGGSLTKRGAKRLRNNHGATTRQARCRFDTIGQCHLGKNVNKMVGGSLVMPSNNNAMTGGGGTGSTSGKLPSSPAGAPP
jgi:hypothetical protein